MTPANCQEEAAGCWQHKSSSGRAWLTSSCSLSALAFSMALRRACCSCCICHHSLDCSCCARVRSAMDRSSPSKRCREAGPQRGSSSPNLQQWALSSSCKLWSATARLESSSPSLQACMPGPCHQAANTGCRRAGTQQGAGRSKGCWKVACGLEADVQQWSPSPKPQHPS